MDKTKIVAEGITFDDVLLIPAKSDLVPSQADTRTRLTDNITINIPIVSAAMDTVTEARLAIALAQEGGIGIIHKNLSVEAQQREVAKVKRSEHGQEGPAAHERAKRLGNPYSKGKKAGRHPDAP
jgi:IMP dehydrogenase